MCPDHRAADLAEADLVAELPSGRVHLQNDADYRGYCILVFRRHAVELHELTEDERGQWIADIARIGKAISEACAPAKLNIAMLGNQVPHLHSHIIPRYPADPEWGQPPVFRSPEDRRALLAEEYEALRTTLRHALASR